MILHYGYNRNMVNVGEWCNPKGGKKPQFEHELSLVKEGVFHCLLVDRCCMMWFCLYCVRYTDLYFQCWHSHRHPTLSYTLWDLHGIGATSIHFLGKCSMRCSTAFGLSLEQRAYFTVWCCLKARLWLQCTHSISPPPPHSHKDLPLVTHAWADTFTCAHKHQFLPLGAIIVPTGTPQRPITTTGGTKKTSFILLSCCPSFWYDFSFHADRFPFY